MQVAIFKVSADASEEELETLNKFLRGHKVIDMQQEFVVGSLGAYWHFCIRFIGNAKVKSQSGIKKVDYKETLDAQTFEAFSILRDLRNEMAKEMALSAFVIFTNEELAQMAALSEKTLTTIKTIKGIGEQKAEKYGRLLLEKYHLRLNEKNRPSN